jgi:hypothetical protein
MDLGDFIGEERFDNVARKAAETLSISVERTKRIMNADFFASFFSGYYGRGVMMIAAGESYIRDLEDEFEYEHKKVKLEG